MILEEVVVLTRTVPEESKKYGRRVCLAAYCRDLGHLIRVYPTTIDAPVKTGSVCRLRVTKNTDDNRCESFRLSDAIDGLLSVGDQMPAVEVRRMLASRYPTSDSISELNARRASLGVVHSQCEGSLRSRKSGSVIDPSQALFWDDLFCFDDRQQVAPYVTFGKHTLQLREWGCHEWLRKNPDQDRAAMLWNILKFGRDQMLVIGNMMHKRNVWMVLKTYAMDTSPLFSRNFG